MRYNGKKTKLTWIAILFLVSVLWMPGKQQMANAATASRQAVVDYAMQYVGKVPYVWGGNSFTTGMDCSGFVCGVYNQFGINLWPYRGAIRNSPLVTNVGPNLSLAEKGDILWFQGHVGIYTGIVNGKHYMVNETTGTYNGIKDNVIYSPVSICAAELKGVLKINQFNNDTISPVISNVTASNITNSSYTTTFTVTDNVGIKSVQIAAFNRDTGWVEGTPLVNATHVSGNTWKFDYTGLTVEGNYQVDIYAYDYNGNRAVHYGKRVYIDKTRPIVSDIKIIEVTNNSFTTTFTVTDNVGIKKVQIAAFDWAVGWNDSSKFQQAVKVSGNTWKFTYTGLTKGKKYKVDIYPIDNAGNWGSGMGPIMVFNGVGNVDGCFNSVGHSWGSRKVLKSADCKYEGKVQFTCCNCGGTKEESIPITNDHSFYEEGRISVEPSCVPGEKIIWCTWCGYEITEPIAANGVHTYDSGVVTAPATATSTGVKTFTCIGCGTTKTEIIPKVEYYRLRLASGDVESAFVNGEERILTFQVLDAVGRAYEIYYLGYETLCSGSSPLTVSYMNYYDQFKLKASDTLTGSIWVNFCGYIIKDGKEKPVNLSFTFKVEKKKTETIPSTPSKPTTPTSPSISKPTTPTAPTLNLVKTVKGKDYSVTIAKTQVTGNGKSQKPKITVKYKNKTLKSKYYTVKYTANKFTGLATATVKGKGSYKSKIPSTKIQFVITPKKMKTPTVKAGKGTAKITWKTEKQVTGYQIQISTNKKFKSDAQLVNMKSGKKSTTISNLTRKKTYYVRTRAYKTIQGTTFYGSWSSGKKVKIK